MEASGAATAIDQSAQRGAGAPRTRILRQGSSDTCWEWWREFPVGHVSVMFTLGPPGRVVAGAGVGPTGAEYRGGWVSGLQEGR